MRALRYAVPVRASPRACCALLMIQFGLAVLAYEMYRAIGLLSAADEGLQGPPSCVGDNPRIAYCRSCITLMSTTPECPPSALPLGRQLSSFNMSTPSDTIKGSRGQQRSTAPQQMPYLYVSEAWPAEIHTFKLCTV